MNKTTEKVSESTEHLRIKQYLYHNIPPANSIRYIEEEHRLEDQIVDLYIELEDNKKIAIEIQHSKIVVEDLLSRTIKYNKKNINVLWILNGNGPYYYRIPKKETGVIISLSEKEIHQMYRGRIYYINMAEDGLVAPLYAVHLASYYEKKINHYGFDSYKKSSMKRSVVWHPISSLNLICFKNKGMKLARFNDVNLEVLCQNELIQVLNGFLNYEDKNLNSLNIPGLPLAFIIRKFSKKYSPYLLFDILKRLKFVKSRDLKYFLDKDLQFKKFLLT